MCCKTAAYLRICFRRVLMEASFGFGFNIESAFWWGFLTIAHFFLFVELQKLNVRAKSSLHLRLFCLEKLAIAPVVNENVVARRLVAAKSKRWSRVSAAIRFVTGVRVNWCIACWWNNDKLRLMVFAAERTHSRAADVRCFKSAIGRSQSGRSMVAFRNGYRLTHHYQFLQCMSFRRPVDVTTTKKPPWTFGL